ncbi:MAG: serine/threonine protein kinase [Polyangiaceae bacterium]|nr:serine/threonine protein kinase [Polyangiaceae bacterium]
MAAVHFARLKGEAGFTRTVAVKRLHPSFSEDANIVSTVLDEARLASRIQHPNVVAMVDVVVDRAEILLVLEYVHGESLSKLLRASPNAPDLGIVIAVLSGTLHGLHAAHEARSAAGEPLGIDHRDVSPQNILVGVDGLARVLDFGIAKARGQLQTTREGQVKGKLAYMAPEQIRQGSVTARTDVFAAGIVLWEALTGKRLFAGENEGQVMFNVLGAPVANPSSIRPEIGPEVDAVVMKALERDPELRFASASDFAIALEGLGLSAPSAVGRWVASVAEKELTARAARVASIESARGGCPVVDDNAEAPTRTDLGASQEPTKTEHSAVVAPLPESPPKRGSNVRWLAAAAGVTAAGALAIAIATSRQTSTAEAGASTAAPAASDVSNVASAAIVASSVAIQTASAAPEPPSSAMVTPGSAASTSKRSVVRAPVSAPKASAAPAPSATAPKEKFYRFE